jgi:hypothetical protein
MLVCLLRSASGVGVCSSRTSAVAGARTRACRAMVGQERPDVRTISAVRQRPLEACNDVLVQVGRGAGAMGRVRVGPVATEGTKRQGHASRHQAMRYGSMQQAVERLREESAAVVTQADQQDAAAEAALGRRRGDALPAALARRAARLVPRAAAMRRVETQAKADAQVERQRRAAAAAARERPGQRRRGTAPPPGLETPDAQAQRHWTAPARPLLRTHQKGGDSCGKAPASVDATWQSLVACDVTDASHDTQQAEPLAQATLATRAQAGLKRPTDESGTAHALPATLDHGSDSAVAVPALEA